MAVAASEPDATEATRHRAVSPMEVVAASPRIASDARFLPGQIVGQRFRMVSPLGQGGMGEVYRADDLTLGQPVALKFLPPDVEADPRHLARFLNEVKLALRVTHPHVCRVYDIGQVGERHFISMEYVDGEDLASLLRRIGRLPEDKALEIARQLCAGLQAAHDEGVLHRDLKPSNVMLDGRGRAKIADFGLAGAVAGIAGREAQVGTPQYMAPEQFAGGELSVQTDLYALGLIVYELFTGKRVFEGRDALALWQQRSSTAVTLSTQSGLDPIVARAIQHCLHPDPSRRPRSAKALADALPGGDPLAIALAAGETPSPELVAGAGGTGVLRPWVAASLLGVVLVGLGLTWYTEGVIQPVTSRIPLPKTPAELQIAAQQALTAAGYTQRGAGRARGFVFDTDFFLRAEQTDASLRRWDGLATVTPTPLWFWYREAAAPMSPMNDFGDITISNPPLLDAGMTRVRLDPSGRLQELMAVPPNDPAAEGPRAEPDWAPLFTAAGLVSSEWTPAEPKWPSPGAADARRAWTRGTVRIEAASFRGRPTWFRVVPAWRRPSVIAPPQQQAVIPIVVAVTGVAILAAALFLARRNIRQGRGDLRGAARLAVAYLILGVVTEWARLANPPGNWFAVFGQKVALQVSSALVLWAGYLAIEPYMRRWWPTTLVAWSRALDGRFRDPMVGRDVLLGAALAVLFTFAPKTSVLMHMRPPDAAEMAIYLSPMSWTSDRAYLAALLERLSGAFFSPVTLVLLLLVLRVIVRRTWLTYLVLYAGFALTAGRLAGVSTRTDVAIVLILNTLMLLILTRLGFLALITAMFYSLTVSIVLTADRQSWFFHQSVITMAVFGGIAIYAAWVSIGNQQVFEESVL
jgi:serine/threonine-protein kinase